MFTMRPYFDRICVFVIILLENEVSGRFLWQSDFSVKTSTCHSPKCDTQAKYYHSLLNYDINPCDDFYQHVCSKWMQRHLQSDYYSQWSIDMQMADNAFERMKNILYTVPSHLDSKELKEGRALYEACMNIPYLGVLDAPSLRNYITKADYFPLIMKKTEHSKNQKLSWLGVHHYYLSITGESAFFSIDIIGDSEENMKPQLRISPMESPFGLIVSFEVLTTHKLILYNDFVLATVIHSIPPQMCKVSYTLIEKRLLDVLVFRRKLWKLIRENQPKSSDCYLMTLKTFNSLYPPKNSISWANIIYSFYIKTDHPLNITTMNICMKKGEYFNVLTELLSETDDDILVNHIHLYFIERHLKLTTHLKKMLRKVVIQDGKLEGEIRYLGKREVECLLTSEITDGFGKAYISRHFPSEIKKRGELMVNRLKDVMKIQICQSTWLDDDMIKKTTDKIEKMKMAVGYPEYYDDPKLGADYIDSHERMRAITSDIFYSGLTNRMSISAAFFTPPLYDVMFPPSVVYGTIGASIAHEMYHAFGPYFLHHRSLPVYWSKEMLSKHTKKTECYVEQFNNKSVQEFRHIPNAPTIDGHRTLDENLSDSMGLNLAYWAFRKEIWKLQKCEILKGPPNLTCNQLFFVSYASSFCATMSLDKLMELVQNAEHCPDDLRVNEAVSNLEEFSKAFNCSKGAPLNPSKRCNLWL